MPMDVYAVVGALVRAEITRTHIAPTQPAPPEADAAPPTRLVAADVSPASRALTALKALFG
ncbi:hypothetical protein [Streptomyces pseudovenezuelae]|uniref:hypothetical protein n=1 Tax=Streptomyces pseudovenezuelae TaxID=67350 RepID=UPI002E81115B|nr:hypothetical protein [Streptomyces pseudovenezuelae]WUA87493.1 hypothetical protein OHO81_09415 [Streptomyces pseudovenezuelae]